MVNSIIRIILYIIVMLSTTRGQHTFGGLELLHLFHKQETNTTQLNQKSVRSLHSPNTMIFTSKFRESLHDIFNLEKVFSKHLNKLEQLLTSNLLPNESAAGVGLLPIPKLSLLPDMAVLQQLFHSGRHNIHSTAICHACRIGFALFLFKARTGIGYNELQALTILGCKIFKIASNEVCNGLVTLYAPILQFIGNQRMDLTPDRFCGVVLQAYGCIARDWKHFEWTLDIQPYFGNNQLLNDYPITSQHSNINGGRILKIIHLADIHVDPDYVIGSDAVCSNELCCRGIIIQDSQNRNAAGAGYYGDLRKCDLPYHSLENALQHISQQHPDTELIYMTGDIVPHDVWATHPQTNIQIIHNITKLLEVYFPNVRVIPVIGNHESHPVNMFAPVSSKISKTYSPEWLYEAATQAWMHWIPLKSRSTFLKSGYYSVKVKSGFRVIVLNTNLCYGFNFWYLHTFKDPGGQLTWLNRKLHNARANNEVVHLVGHIPPGQNECVSTWSRNFYDIVNSYQDIIQAQFYGHTHYDEFQVYYDKIDKSRPISPVFMGPSLSPFINLNPGYKVYHVHDTTWNVMDFETWIYNLNDANQNPQYLPKWYCLYKATQLYKIPNVLPNSLHSLIQQMSSNSEIFNLYYRNYFKNTAESLVEECDGICRKRMLCNMVTSYYEGQSECIELESGIDGVILPKRIFEKFRTILINPFDKTVIQPVNHVVLKPLEKFGKSIAGLFNG